MTDLQIYLLALEKVMLNFLASVNNYNCNANKVMEVGKDLKKRRSGKIIERTSLRESIIRSILLGR